MTRDIILFTAAGLFAPAVIIATIRPSFGKIVAALTYSNKPGRSVPAPGPTRAHSLDCVGPEKGN